MSFIRNIMLLLLCDAIGILNENVVQCGLRIHATMKLTCISPRRYRSSDAYVSDTIRFPRFASRYQQDGITAQQLYTHTLYHHTAVIHLYVCIHLSLSLLSLLSLNTVCSHCSVFEWRTFRATAQCHLLG